MNVLILTPDAVGSTLLQRMLTIYMQFHEFNKPVINLHELTNGLLKYYSPDFNQEIIGRNTKQNGYYQSLNEIVTMLDSVSHYKTSRLAHYHIVRRGDTINQQIPFYNYLNDNFYIIACRRNNVFEHALSMSLNKITKKLNVYDPAEKVNAFIEIYKSGVNLDPDAFVNQLNAYKMYIEWSTQYFNISSYFNYEKDVPNLEKYILDLPIFAGQQNLVSWSKNFGISFNDWNKMHYIRGDVNKLLSIPAANLLENIAITDHEHIEKYQQIAPEGWPAINSPGDLLSLPTELKQQWADHLIHQEGIIPFLNENTQKNLEQYQHGYRLAQQTIDQMIHLGIIINGPPLKKQTLAEKSKIIKNFDFLCELYNQWAELNPDIAKPITSNFDFDTESNFWNSLISSDDTESTKLPNLI